MSRKKRDGFMYRLSGAADEAVSWNGYGDGKPEKREKRAKGSSRERSGGDVRRGGYRR